MKKKKRIKISKFEKFIYTIAIFLLIVSPFLVVFMKSALSEVNYEVEKIKKSISKQEKANQSLEMKINELASLENIQDVIKNQGLIYNNDSIKNID